MEQSAVNKNSENQSIETEKPNPMNQVEIPKVSAKKNLPNGIVADTEEIVRNYKMALVDLWLLVTPYLLNCRIVKPFFEDTIAFLEYVAKKLDAFSEKYESIKDVKPLDILVLVRSFGSEALEFLQSDSSERIAMKYLVHSHMLILESLDYAAKLMEYAVPVVPGVKPLMELDVAERSIRKKCACLILNLFYRIMQRTTVYAEYSCDYLRKCVRIPVFACTKVEVPVNVASKE